MKIPRPHVLQVLVLWTIAVVLLLTTVVVPALANFNVKPIPSPQGPTVAGRIVAILEQREIQSARGPILHERFSVALDGQEIVIERDREKGGIVGIPVEAGAPVLVSQFDGPDGPAFAVVDRFRATPLWILTVAFVAMVLITSGLLGASSLLGLVASLLVIMRFIVPGILTGHDPVLVAVAGALVIMGTTLYLAHGINLKTTVALGGTALALLFTAVVAVISIHGFSLTGIATEDAVALQVLSSTHIPADGLLLAGVVIGALGVLDDITVAQVAAVFELRDANYRLSPIQLYRRAMNVGRDHIAATVNTLVLAYAGASLPLLMLLVLQNQPLVIQVNREFMATEIVRTLVGSMGIVLAVPLTTALAAFVAGVAHVGEPNVTPTP